MIVPYDFMQKFCLISMAFLAYSKVVQLIIARKRCRVWTRDIFDQNERELHGQYAKIFAIIKERDSDQFQKTCRIGVRQFELLSSLLKNKLTHYSPRKPIEADCRLVLTLVFLAQGTSWQALSLAFRLGASTVREIILETCGAIWEVLHDIYLAPPSENDWREIADDIYSITGMPNCAGAIDGRYIKMKCPPHPGYNQKNYKNYDSIVLVAACDINYCFTAVDIGACGSQSVESDEKTSFRSKLLKGETKLPPNEHLPNSNVTFPFYFIGDSSFPLKNGIMRPYSKRHLEPDEVLFNNRLSAARERIENTFGIMTAKWRVLLNTINCFPQNAEIIVKAVVVLHNFAKINDSDYCPDDYVDHLEDGKEVKGLWRKENVNIPQCSLFSRFNAPRSAFVLRDTLKDYINQKYSQ